jgi:hypothetical protein
MLRIKINVFPAHAAGTHIIQPNILRYSKHPTIQPGSWLPLLHTRQRTRTRVLNQVVSLIPVPGQRICKSP